MPRLGPPLDHFRHGDHVTNVPVYVVEASAKSDRNQNPFARYQLRDRTGTIGAIRWQYALAPDEQGGVALVSGQIGDYNGALQLTIADMVYLDDPPDEVVQRLRAPVDREQRRRLRAVLDGARQSMAPIFWALFREALGADPFDETGPFWSYAAAQSMHHAQPGGLAWHVLTMLDHVDAIAGHYPGLDTDLLKLAVLTHDLGKLDTYRMNLFGAERLPSDRTVGHTAYSMQRVMRAVERLRARGLAVTPEDEENLLHAIAAHHGRLDWGAVVEPISPEAAALHALDLLDARLRGGLDQRTAAPPARGLLREVTGADGPAEPVNGSHGDGNGKGSQPTLF